MTFGTIVKYIILISRYTFVLAVPKTVTDFWEVLNNLIIFEYLQLRLLVTERYLEIIDNTICLTSPLYYKKPFYIYYIILFLQQTMRQSGKLF